MAFPAPGRFSNGPATPQTYRRPCVRGRAVGCESARREEEEDGGSVGRRTGFGQQRESVENQIRDATTTTRAGGHARARSGRPGREPWASGSFCNRRGSRRAPSRTECAGSVVPRGLRALRVNNNLNGCLVRRSSASPRRRPSPTARANLTRVRPSARPPRSPRARSSRRRDAMPKRKAPAAAAVEVKPEPDVKPELEVRATASVRSARDRIDRSLP